MKTAACGGFVGSVSVEGLSLLWSGFEGALFSVLHFRNKAHGVVLFQRAAVRSHERQSADLRHAGELCKVR